MDGNKRLRQIIFNTGICLSFVTVVLYLLWSLRPLLLPVIIGILLAYLFRPLKTAFKYSWLPNGVRVGIIFLAFTSVIVGTTRFVKDTIPNDKEKLEILVRLKYKFNEKFEKSFEIDPATGKGNSVYSLMAQDLNPVRDSLNRALDLSPEQAEDFLAYYNGVEGYDPVPEKYYQYFLANKKTNHPKRNPAKNAKSAADKPTEKTNETNINSQNNAEPHPSLLKTMLGILSIWLLMPIIFIFFLLDDGSISQFFFRFVPNRYFELAITVQEEVDLAIGKYLRGISMECSLVGISLFIGLFLIGVPLQVAFLISLLAGFATAIPMMAPVVGLGFSLVYALIAEEVHPVIPFMTLDHLVIAVLVVNGIVIALDNAIYQPVVLGSAVNLHPLAVILGIMGGSMMFGMTGVLLAIPTIVVMKAIVQHTFRGLKDYQII